VGTALLYIRCRVSHYNGCVKVEFNDISLYTKKNDSKRRLSAYTTTTFHNMFFDISINVINFTIGIAVGWSNFYLKPCTFVLVLLTFEIILPYY